MQIWKHVKFKRQDNYKLEDTREPRHTFLPVAAILSAVKSREQVCDGIFVETNYLLPE